MFDKLFRKAASPVQNPAPPQTLGPHTPDASVLDMAADMLAAPSALMQLSPQDARVVVRYMHPQRISAGTVFIKEGDEHNTGYMVLVIDGEVTVESIVVSRVSPITVTVLGPGSMHGELGLFDGMPRSASCTASSDVVCAVLTRQGLQGLLDKHPTVCAKLMMAISMRIGERLRDNTEKLKRYVQLTKAMQQEIDHLMPTGPNRTNGPAPA